MVSKFDRGLSGCSFEMITQGVLRKSSSENYSERLLKQAKKQRYFSNFNFTSIDVPNVLNIGENYFDMEYISSKTFDSFFETCDVDDINFVLNSLYEYFDFLIGTKKTFKDFEIKNKIFKKIQSLNISNIHFKEYLLSLDYNTSGIPKSFCHGDLTFSNILFNGKRLFFIDFLDSYVDSFLIDLVKLKQDLFYFWSIQINDNRSLRLYQAKKFIWKNLSKRYQEYVNTNLFELLDVISLLRITPYLTNNNHKTILNNILISTNLYEKFNYSNCRKILKVS